MCIAIVKPAGHWVSKEHLANSFKANPHGAGYAYIGENGKVVTKKGFFAFDKFFKSYSKDVTTETMAFVHFRIATKGKTDEANCHPFAIDNGVLMHNGPCLNYVHCKGDAERSDSREFAEDMVKTLNLEQIKSLRPVIESFAGTEKVAFLFDGGEYVICNEKQGLWSEGCWYSNTSFRGYFNVTTGNAYRGQDSFGGYGGYAGGGSYDYRNKVWDPDSRTYKERDATSQTVGTPVGTKAPTNLEQVIKRTFGGSDLFESKWSLHLKTFCPMHIIVDNTELVWSESMKAFLPTDLANDLASDNRYVYEATNIAQQRKTGPNMKSDMDWTIVADCLQTEHDLRVFLKDAKPFVPPVVVVEAPKVETPPTTELVPVADASATKTADTVH
jgi:hypothetical protein